MNWIFYILIIFLLAVFFQDIKNRQIYWFLPICVFISALVFRYSSFPYDQFLWNLGFIITLLLLLFIYIKIRFKERGKDFFSYFGLGDVMLLLAITPLFPFQNFIYVFTFGTCFALLVFLVANIVKKVKTVPYAGYLSLFISGILLLEKLDLITLTTSY
jgi:membrane-associated HD superfamily phosphohydrolase